MAQETNEQMATLFELQQPQGTTLLHGINLLNCSKSVTKINQS